MRTSVFVLAIIVAAGLVAGPASLQEVVGPSPYDVVEGWLKPFAEPGYAFGSHRGVFAESPDRILVIQRGEYRLPDPLPSGFAGFVGSIGLSALRPEPEDARIWRNCIFVVDGDGNMIEAWTQWDNLYEGSNGPPTRSGSARTTPNGACGWSTKPGTRSTSSRTTAKSC